MLELGNRSSAEHYRIGRIAAAEGRPASDLRCTLGAHGHGRDYGRDVPARIAEHFDTHEDLVRMLKMRAGEADVILFKGGRGMQMEQVLQLFLDDQPKP